MVTLEEATMMALSLPEVAEGSHFGQQDFRVRKKIFAVIHPSTQTVVIKLSPEDQGVFCAFDKEIIYPVPGGWGKQGSTTINLKKIRKRMFWDALSVAWKQVAGPKLTNQYFPAK